MVDIQQAISFAGIQFVRYKRDGYSDQQEITNCGLFLPLLSFAHLKILFEDVKKPIIV